MGRISVGDATVEVFEQGAGEPVLLLHSSGASGLQWRALAQRLAQQYAVLAPDLYGYGATSAWPGSAPFSLAHEAALLDALLDRFGTRVHLVGHSYGGAVALHLARTRGARVGSLTLFEPVAFHLLRGGADEDTTALGEISALAGAVGGALASGDYQAGAAHFVDYWNGSGAWAVLPAPRRVALAERLHKVALDFQATMHEAAPLHELARIHVPTLLMCGARSPLPAQRICRRLAQLLPCARLEVLDDAGHMAPLTHREQVNERIAAHLHACSTSARPTSACDAGELQPA